MCRFLLPGTVASRASEPVRAAAEHQCRWTQLSSSGIPEVQKRVMAFYLRLEIPLLHLILVERFPDAEDLQWFRRLVYGFSMRWLEFDPRPATCYLLWTHVTGTEFFPPASVFPCHYHSTNAPYSFIHSFIHLARTLHNQISQNLENCWVDYGGSKPS